ncbi:MAG: NAD(P)(+) transhydrogenase (Re/Si-specific) subunit beta [Alphaproteobacteria bacterium]|nr:NAD(P)(+) transhydrogenase (Re/Si-specific) subunit beta [Alphaproteobacteria bacterium]
MMSSLTYFAYLAAAVCFIMALRGLSSPVSARQGNLYGMAGMAIGVLTTLTLPQVQSYSYTLLGIILGGTVGTLIAKRIAMTAMPQLVAAFHSLVGLAAVLIALAALWSPESYGIGSAGDIHFGSLIEMSLGVIIGAITFTGSIVAFGKLQGLISGKPVRFKSQHLINAALGAALLFLLLVFSATEAKVVFLAMVAISLALGVLLIIPIGGADMPVVVSMLNSYSGWAAVGIGFTLGNPLLIIAGALIGSSGAILSYIMCKAMNRSIINVIFGGFGATAANAPAAGGVDERPVKTGAAEDAAFLMGNADSVIIVPGYGMAVAQAQHAVRELAEALAHKGIRVRYAIHPVAGRMPGHMNVLLAEANVPYEAVVELEEINSDFGTTDVVYVIGANDVTNPAAKNDPKSPIYGMPILNVGEARNVIFNKRSMAAGYAGIQNELFYQDNTMMLFGDAKVATENLVKALKAL